MLGVPVSLAKTLVLAPTQLLASRLVFLLSYFIRCSLVFKQELSFPPCSLPCDEAMVTYRSLALEIELYSFVK